MMPRKNASEINSTPPSREDVFAQEDFLVAVQMTLERQLKEKGLKKRDLARRLGVSEARVSQIFNDPDANLTIKTVARLFFHMHESPCLLTKSEVEQLSVASPKDSVSSAGWVMFFDEPQQSAEDFEPLCISRFQGWDIDSSWRDLAPVVQLWQHNANEWEQ